MLTLSGGRHSSFLDFLVDVELNALHVQVSIGRVQFTETELSTMRVYRTGGIRAPRASNGSRLAAGWKGTVRAGTHPAP